MKGKEKNKRNAEKKKSFADNSFSVEEKKKPQ